MDFYRIIGCRSNDGSDWRALEFFYCNKSRAIEKAKEHRGSAKDFFPFDQNQNINNLMKKRKS